MAKIKSILLIFTAIILTVLFSSSKFLEIFDGNIDYQKGQICLKSTEKQKDSFAILVSETFEENVQEEDNCDDSLQTSTDAISNAFKIHNNEYLGIFNKCIVYKLTINFKDSHQLYLLYRKILI